MKNQIVTYWILLWVLKQFYLLFKIIKVFFLKLSEFTLNTYFIIINLKHQVYFYYHWGLKYWGLIIYNHFNWKGCNLKISVCNKQRKMLKRYFEGIRWIFWGLKKIEFKFINSFDTKYLCLIVLYTMTFLDTALSKFPPSFTKNNSACQICLVISLLDLDN